jgi:hypothetical protein
MVITKDIKWDKLASDSKGWVESISYVVANTSEEKAPNYRKNYVTTSLNNYARYIYAQQHFFNALDEEKNEEQHKGTYELVNSIYYAQHYGSFLSTAEKQMLEKMKHIILFFESNKQNTSVFSDHQFTKFSKRVGRDFLNMKQKITDTYNLKTGSISDAILGETILGW